MYEKRINTARIIIAAMCAVCGTGLVICANYAEHLRTIRRDPESWQLAALAFGNGILVCLAVVFVLVFEGILRYSLNARIQFGLRTLLLIVTLSAVVCGFIAVLKR